MTAGQKRGCLEGGARTKPKTRLPSLEAAYVQIEWMVENLTAVREHLRAYESRYSDPGEPHFHVGRIPVQERKQYGRMPAVGGNHRR